MVVHTARFAACAVLATATVLAGAVPVRANVLFDNFGPGDTYHTSAGRGFGDAVQGMKGPFTLETGMDFSVSGGDFFLDTIELAASFGEGENLLFLDVYADNAGVPGVLLESTTVENQMGPPGQLNPPVVAIFSGRTVLAEALMYWVVASGGVDQAIWNHNNIGDMGFNVFRADMGDWILNAGGDLVTRGAFRVNGTPVPAPGPIALVALVALVGVGVRRRRRDAQR